MPVGGLGSAAERTLRTQTWKWLFSGRSGAVGQGKGFGEACFLDALAEDAGDPVLSHVGLKLGDYAGGVSTVPDGGDIGACHLAVSLDEPIGEDVEMWTT